MSKLKGMVYTADIAQAILATVLEHQHLPEHARHISLMQVPVEPASMAQKEASLEAVKHWSAP